MIRGQKTYLKRIINDFEENAHSVLNDISELQERLIQGGNDEPTLFEQLETMKEQIEGKKEEINSMYDFIFKPSPSVKKSMALQLHSFLEEFEHQKNLLTLINVDIKDFSGNLFGRSDADCNAVLGIQDRIYVKIGDFEKLCEHDTRSKSICSLKSKNC